MLSSGIVKWRDVLALTQGFSISVGLYILDLQRDVRLPRSNTKDLSPRRTLYRRRLHTTVIVGPQFPWV